MYTFFNCTISVLLMLYSAVSSFLGVQRYIRVIFTIITTYVCSETILSLLSPQRGAADAEIKVPSDENTELKRSPFIAWSRSVYSHMCYAYCQGFLPCLFLPFQSIHLHFFQNFPDFFLCWLWLTLVPM